MPTRMTDYSPDFDTLEKMEWAFSKGDVAYISKVLDSRPSIVLRIHGVCMLADMKREDAMTALARALREDPSPLVRHEAAFAMGQLEFKSGVPSLLEAMARDESVLVRHESAVALGSVGDERARPGLMTALEDVDEDVRLSAEVALDRKSTRLNSSHSQISYAVFCLKKKNTINSVTISRSLDIDPDKIYVTVGTVASAHAISNTESLHPTSVRVSVLRTADDRAIAAV